MLEKENTKKLLLIGNPNIGKSTLFNLITGLNQKVGNFAGVTVDIKEGNFNYKDNNYELIDLPGIYSLHANTPDEEIVIRYLEKCITENSIYKIVLMADATNLKRSLYLCSQILDLNIPAVLVVNMVDLLNESKLKIDFDELQKSLQIEVVAISARNNSSIQQLFNVIEKTNSTNRTQFFDYNNHIKNFTKDTAFKGSYLEYTQFLKKLSLEQKQKIINTEVIERYRTITQSIKSSLSLSIQNAKPKFHALDKLFTHKVWGYFIFVALLLLVFQSIFSLAQLPMDIIEQFFLELISFVKPYLGTGILQQLITEALLPGLSGIFIFIPQIAFLFFFISVLEDTGYMARISFIMDKIMRKFGLNGKSVIPLVGGVACAVPSIMGTRTISNTKERLITILVLPLMSCSARLPVYTILIALVIPNTMFLGIVSYQALTLLFLYLVGIFAALAIAFVLKKYLPQQNNSYFIMELPQYRLPRLKNILLLILEKVKVFILETGKIILAISIVLWFLASNGNEKKFLEIEQKYTIELSENKIDSATYTNKVNAEKLEFSYAGSLGKTIEPLIKPLGYDWKIGIAIISSFAAREVFVSTLSTIYGVKETDSNTTLKAKLNNEKWSNGNKIYTLASCLSLMIFYAFALQCMSTLSVVYKETQNIKYPIFQFVYMALLAYISAFIVFTIFTT
jgi:ferrous iron transport protein B